MSLTLSLNNALSGLLVSQQSLAVLSQNIANANNASYSRQTVNESALSLGAGAIGAGVTIDSISRDVDNFIQQNVVSSGSDVSKATAVNTFYQQIQLYMGQPGQSNSIDTYVNNFFNAMSSLSVSPETSSLKLAAVSSATTLAQQVSSLATNVTTLQFNADQQISTSVSTVNNDLNKLFQLNQAIRSAASNNQSTNSLLDSAQSILNDLGSQLNITYHSNADGTIAVATTGGTTLLGVDVSQLSYTPASSAGSFTNNGTLSPITVTPMDASGNPVGSPVELVSGGTAGSVTTTLTSGNIAGLLQVRDQLAPNILSQLDQLASQLTTQVNAVSNNGVSYPPPSSLTGTTLVNPSSSQGWNGSVMIAALNPDGTPVASPYASQQNAGIGMTPLTLNLGALDGGQPSYQDIINHINQYYGVPQPKAEINGLDNIQLTANSDSLTAGSGNFNFSVNLSNLSSGATSFVVTGATMSGGANITSPATFPSSPISVPAGATLNTDGTLNFTADMSSAGAGPYTVTLNVQTTDAQGITTTGTVTYTLNNAASNLKNDNYAATSGTGGVTVEAPTTNKPIMTAKLVDANGNEVAKDPLTGDYTASGYLEIEGENGNSVGISELDSSALGNPGVHPPVPATNYGFSQYFGLNNFFTDNGQVANSAINFSVNQSFVTSPQNIPTGQLGLSTQPTDPTQPPRYTYELGSGSAQTLNAISNLSQNQVKFATAGTLPAVALTFTAYAAEILGFTATNTSNATTDLNQQTLIQQGFQAKDTADRGVNIDEEMANTILFQNAYSANARVISVTKELFDALIQAFT